MNSQEELAEAFEPIAPVKDGRLTLFTFLPHRMPKTI